MQFKHSLYSQTSKCKPVTVGNQVSKSILGNVAPGENKEQEECPLMKIMGGCSKYT